MNYMLCASRLVMSPRTNSLSGKGKPECDSRLGDYDPDFG
jgi:hypothetical protein